MKMEFKTISKEAKLILNGEEGYEVDWKRSMEGLDSEDIVAFANSKNGGAILIGVDEVKGKDGKQEAEIVGCKCNDKTKMGINTKAAHCIPPIVVEIFKENTNEKPFYRLEIPSGENKPYCTQKGIYKIREDGNNRAITPNELLLMFMDLESDKFLKKFKEATKEIENNLFVVSKSIDESLNHLGDIVPQLKDLEEYASLSEQNLGVTEKIEDYVENIGADLNQNERRILALFDHFNIEDPYVVDLKENIKEMIKLDDEYGKDIYHENYLEELESRFSKLNNDQLKICHQKAVKEINNKS